MTLLRDLRSRDRDPSWARTGPLLVAGFGAQALASVIVWLVVDDSSRGGGWSNTDFERWALFSVACAGLLAVLGGASARRTWAAWMVAVGCLLATALGCAIFVAYAVVNSG